jgi:hypothetical protein
MKRLIWGTMLCVLLGVHYAVAAPERVTAKPIESNKITVYAYKVEPLIRLDEAKPGFLAEVAKLIVKHPNLPVEVEVSPAPILMKYRLIQAVGVCGIGVDSDFSPDDLKNLAGLPLFQAGEKTYKLYFNSLNPQGPILQSSAAGLLDGIKRDGTFEVLMQKYGLK